MLNEQVKAMMQSDLRAPFILNTGQLGRGDWVGECHLLAPLAGDGFVRSILRRRPTPAPHGPVVPRLRDPGIIAAYLLWQAARSGTRPPRLADLDWAGLPDAACTFVVEVIADAARFRFVKVGSTLSARIGRDLTDEIVDESDENIVGSLANAYARCVTTLLPSHEFARFDFGDGLPVTFEQIVMPASSSGHRITHLVGLAILNGDW